MTTTDHLAFAKNAIRCSDLIAERSDDPSFIMASPGAMQDREFRMATACALIDIAESLRFLRNQSSDASRCAGSARNPSTVPRFSVDLFEDPDTPTRTTDPRDLIRRLCLLQQRVATRFGHMSPNDCFCGEGGYWTKGDWPDGPSRRHFQSSFEAVEFIEQAVEEALTKKAER